MEPKVSSRLTRGFAPRPEHQDIMEKDVIAIQAAARGAAERKKLKANGGPKIQKQLVKDDKLEFKEEVVLADGSVFTG
jgi:hypothetical protein